MTEKDGKITELQKLLDENKIKLEKMNVVVSEKVDKITNMKK